MRALLDVNLLIALAVRNRGRFVIFDARITLEAVPGARDRHLLVLGRA